jgi:hypothetical protein
MEQDIRLAQKVEIAAGLLTGTVVTDTSGKRLLSVVGARLPSADSDSGNAAGVPQAT